ncbi:MAG: helix-turn-helix transcriptional regulator, partial [Ruminococcus sp.]|nr:helix-turn-helix transcriptional regulator [Ruminococcus sp.]
ETCGYDSDAYFMRQFKQHKGFTPSEYRRRAVHSE